MGLKVVRRSAGERVRSDTDILLGDTIGEMGLYLRLTEIAFVGRSLTSAGGQNPLEPAMLDTAVLAGRNVQNFREAYQRLIDSGGARIVRDRDDAGRRRRRSSSPTTGAPRHDAGRRCRPSRRCAARSPGR